MKKNNSPLFAVSIRLKVDFIMLKNHLNLFCYDDFVNKRRFLTSLCFRVILVDENRQKMGWPSLFKLRLQFRKLRLPFWWRGLKISQQISAVKWQVLTGSFPKFRVTDSVKLPLISLLLAFILSEEFVRAIGLKIRRKHLSIRLNCLCKCFELFSKTFCWSSTPKCGLKLILIQAKISWFL